MKASTVTFAIILMSKAFLRAAHYFKPALAKMAHPPLQRTPSASDRRPCQVTKAVGRRPWQIRNPRRRQPPSGPPLLQISQNFAKKIKKFQKRGVYRKRTDMYTPARKILKTGGVYLKNLKK